MHIALNCTASLCLQRISCETAKISNESRSSIASIARDDRKGSTSCKPSYLTEDLKRGLDLRIILQQMS